MENVFLYRSTDRFIRSVAIVSLLQSHQHLLLQWRALAILSIKLFD